nr:retrovirus-related Pol polyprotein from transposon TNT 1-94 [Tanacetum cinerariifolium]
YPKDTGFKLTAFSNSDHASCLDSRKSTSGGIKFLGGDKLVSWSFKKQDCTSMSLVEAEYVSLFACCAQVLWLRTQLTDYGFHFDKIHMYYFIKEKVEKVIVELFFVETEYQLADLLTKALSEDRFKYLIIRLGSKPKLSEARLKIEIPQAHGGLRVFELEAICSGLCDEVAGYKLFKEHVEAMQDEQVKALSDRVVDIDADLMNLALHMDEEFYPRCMTTIFGRRWILSRGLKLVIMKCLQSPGYLAALGGAFGCAIDKGMQDGLKAGVDHGRARKGLNVIAAYYPSAEANFVSAFDALRTVNFPLLAQLESRKDASISDIFDLLRLEGHAAEISEASQLQPSFEQLMVPIHRLEDQVVIRETSLSFALDVAHSRVQRLKGDATACRLSLTDAMVLLLEPLSVRSLTGEASTSMVPFAAVTTAFSTTFIQASTIPPLPSTEVPPSPKIVFEEEELNTTPEHTSAP